jgi:hypothetical protein
MAILLLSAVACQQKNPTATAGTTDSTKNFFPVADYINSEISYVDSTPLAIVKYTEQNGHADSSYIRPEEFHRLATELIPAELSTALFEKDYSENSFLDETTKSLTFIYSTKNKELPLQRVDVLAAQGSVAGNQASGSKVKSIYMESSFYRKDTLVTKKVLWQARKSFLVLTSLQPQEKAPIIRQLKVVWDSGE